MANSFSVIGLRIPELCSLLNSSISKKPWCGAETRTIDNFLSVSYLTGRYTIFCSFDSEGIVLAEIWAVFTADAVQPIRSLDLIVKRGRLQNLDVEMDGFDVTQVVGMSRNI